MKHKNVLNVNIVVGYVTFSFLFNLLDVFTAVSHGGVTHNSIVS